MRHNEDNPHRFRRGENAMRTLTPLLAAGCLLISGSECLAGITKVNVVRSGGRNYATIDGSGPAVVASASSDGVIAVGASCEPVAQDIAMQEESWDHWSCAPGSALSFHRINIAVGKDDQLFELAPNSPPLFICGEEKVVGVFKDHYKDVNDDPNYPNLEVWSADFEGGCEGEVDVYVQPEEQGTHPFIKEVYFNYMTAVCPAFVVALVVEFGQTIEILDVTLDGEPVKARTSVTQPHRALLNNVLAAKGSQIFDPQQQGLFFLTWVPEVPCEDQFQVVITFRVVSPYKYCQGGEFEGYPCTDDNDCGGPYCEPEELFFPGNFVLGGTSLQDLINAVQTGAPLSDFEWRDSPILDLDAIPTVSTWGLIVMALLLLIGARTYFGNRRRVSPS